MAASVPRDHYSIDVFAVDAAMLDVLVTLPLEGNHVLVGDYEHAILWIPPTVVLVKVTRVDNNVFEAYHLPDLL